MKKLVLFTCFLALVTASAFSQGGRFWTPNNQDAAAIVKNKAVSRVNYPAEFKLFDLDLPAFSRALLSITGSNRISSSTIISLPNADGGIEQFEVVEASNFEPALQAQFPGIRAFSGRGITDNSASLKLSLSPEGVQTMVFRTDRENEFLEPYSKDRKVYSAYKANRERGRLPWTCSTEDNQMFSDINSRLNDAQIAMAAGTSTGELKTLRLAQSCNGEYANYFDAFSSADVAKVLAAFNATLTRCNGIYERDLALHLNLIANTTAVIYYDPRTDPYTTMSSWNGQLQSTLTANIGESNYDIGHMFGATGGGGNAGCIGCVCVNGKKGSGITSPADGVPEGDNFDIDYVAHEIGHQLGANHTFSHSLEGLGQNKEIGSGITIMGYAGITSYDVAPHSIDIFHETSIAQIRANMATKTCPVTTSANNAAPVIAAVNNYTIPISTPFALTAPATDADGDALTYCWEQNDNATTSGSGSNASPTKATGPNWLSFSPVASPTRLFPQLSTILAGGMTTPRLPGGDAGMNIEALSSVSRTLNFRLTVRDNHPYNSATPTVGQTAFTDVVVTVTNTAGPFQVTSPNTNITWNAGSTANVTWNVALTNTGLVNCAAVKILLSTDGGTTFPHVLASSTANDGSETITVPNNVGTTNRVKVEAIGNIFFDISNANFTIAGAAPTCGVATGLTTSNITETSATVSWNAVSGATSYAVDYKAASSQTWISATSSTSSTSLNLSGLTPGTVYDWRVRATCTSVTGNNVQGQFTTTASTSCGDPTGLTSSNITQNSASLAWNAVSGATSYAVDYKNSSSGTWINAVSATTATTFNLTGLAASTSYDWRVRATCSSGTGNYAVAAFTTSGVTVSCPGAYDGDNNGSFSGASQVPVNTDILGTVSVRGDVDYYKVNLATGNVTISLTSLPADYQLNLRSTNGTTILQSSTNKGTADELINRDITTAGDYYIEVYPRTNGAYNATSCYTLRVDQGSITKMGAENVKGNKQLRAVPNPATSNVNLFFTAPAKGSATISIMTQAGTVVSTKAVAVDAGDNFKKIDVSSLPSGVYLIRVQTGSVLQLTKLAIIK